MPLGHRLIWMTSLVIIVALWGGLRRDPFVGDVRNALRRLNGPVWLARIVSHKKEGKSNAPQETPEKSESYNQISCALPTVIH